MSVFDLNIHQSNVDEVVRFKAAMPDGSQRHFTLRRLTAGPLAAARRVEALYRRANDIEAFTEGPDGTPVAAWQWGPDRASGYVVSELRVGFPVP